MTEHAGGAPKTAFVPIQTWGEQSFEVVPTFQWDPAAADKLSELIEDHVSTGGDVRELMLRVMAPEIREQIALALRRLISFIREAAKPKLAVDQIAWACGLSLIEGETLGTLARAHGISKQAFQQGATKFREAIKVRSQTERSQAAKAKMSQRNIRVKREVGIFHR